MASVTTIASWSRTDYQSATAAQITSLTLDQVKLMLHPDWLLPAAVAGFTAAQIPSINISWYYMNAAWLNALSPSAFAAIPATGIAQMTSTTVIAGLDAAHAAALTTTQIASLGSPQSLNVSAVAVLSAAQLAAIPATKWGSMSAAWLNAVPASLFATIPAASAAKFGSTPIAGLDVAHTQVLTVAQLDAMNVGKFSLTSMAALTPAQLTGMGAAKWSSFTAAQLNAIPAAKFALITTASLVSLGRTVTSGLDAAHVQAMTVAQVAALYYPEWLNVSAVAVLSPEKVAAIRTSFYWMDAAWLNALSPSAFAAITATGIGQLSGTAIAGLDATHAQALTSTQLNAISLGSLSTTAVAALLPAQVASITQNFYWRTPEWLNALSAAAFAAIPPAGITQMKSATIAALDATHVGAMTGAQVAALDYWQRTSLKVEQMGWFSKGAIAGFTTAQLDDLTPAQLAGLTAVQASGLTTAQLASLTPTQLAGLSASAVSGLNQVQLAALGTNLSVLSPAAIAALPVGAFSQLSFMQLSSLQGDQVAALTAQQLASLNATQANYLTAGQLDVLGSRVQSLSASAVAGLSTTNLLYVYAALTPAQQAALTPAQSTAVQRAGATVSTLLGSLTDTTVRAQIEAVVNSGESLFSYNALVQVLGGVASSLGTAGLTQAQMNDLKALTTAVGQSQGTDSYLHRVTSNIVNGNKSNATWTGGSLTSVALGNLAVGSSADQMDKLVSKWFLGGDLPSWTGSTGYTIIDAPLFSAAGPLASDVTQGGIGDCYLMAAMVDVADDYSALLETMFTDNGNGTWGVRLYGANDDPLYVTVSNVLPGGWGRATSASDSLWVSLIEKAYVEWEVQIRNETNDYDSISGGWDWGMLAIAGRSSTYYSASSIALSTWTTTTKATVISALNSGQEVMLSSGINLADVDNGKTNLVPSHMYAVLGYDVAKDELILRNPWGHAGGSGWNGVFDLKFEEMWAVGNGLLVTNEGSPTGAIDTKYAVNASMDQLLQAMASDAGAGGAGDTVLLTGHSQDNSRLTLVTAA
jgi:Calpain family cysteine protease